MIYPAVMFIEMAKDALNHHSIDDLDHELKEFRMMSDGRLNEIRKKFPNYNDFQLGYLLGLETARVIQSGQPLDLDLKL